jgi:FAD/FMN-containing dehydrogenase
MFDNSTDAGWPHLKGQPNGPLVINFKWEGEENDEFWLDKISTMTDTLRELAIAEGCSTNDTPFYLNLALETVTVYEIYRENLDKLTALRRKYDPSNVMNRTGGFRIPG